MSWRSALSFGSVRWRLVASFIVISLVAVGIVGGFSLMLVRHFVRRQETAYLQSNAGAVAKQAVPLMVPVLRPLSLLELAQISAFMSDSRVRILDRNRRVIADSGPAGGSDRVWIQVIATFQSAGSVFRESLLVPVSKDPSLRESLQRSLGMLERIADTQATLVRRRSGLWGSAIEFSDYDGPIIRLDPNLDDEDPGAGDQMRNMYLEPIGDPNNPIGFVEIARSPDLPGEAVKAVVGPFIIAAVAATVLAAVLGLVFGRRLTRPIEELTSSALKMGAGNFDARAPDYGRGEIGELGRQFNAMAGELESTVRDLRQERDVLRRFIADASHELRTPVTALKTFNELLIEGEDGEHRKDGDDGRDDGARAGSASGAEAPESSSPVPPSANAVEAPPLVRGVLDERTRAEFLRDSRRQIERMEWIVENLLNLSRLEAGVASGVTQDTTLRDLIDGVQRRFARRAAELGVELRLVSECDAPLELDLAAVDIALDNLLRNALRYGAAGGVVEVRATCDGAYVELAVGDRGPGVTAEDLPHIFDRFYRGKRVTAAGSGLGLAIAQAGVVANQGMLTVRNNADGPGATFVVRLPLQRRHLDASTATPRAYRAPARERHTAP